MIIRDAEERDISFMIEEGIKFLQLHPANLQKDYEEEYLLELTRNVLVDHVALIAEEDGKNIGMIVGLLSPNPFNPKYVGLQEFIWWVKEEHRNTSAALRLFNAFEERAKEIEVDFISMVSTVHTPTLDKLYQKKKYIPVETAYIKEL